MNYDYLRICGNCKYCTGFNNSNGKLICSLHKCDKDFDSECCIDYYIDDTLFNQGKCCGVCEYYMMDGTCGHYDKFVYNNSICDDFLPCEEFIKGLI